MTEGQRDGKREEDVALVLIMGNETVHTGRALDRLAG